MKTQKKLNILLIVLIILLLSLISFVGIYHQSKSEMINKVPNYILGTNISGSRLIILELKQENDNSEEENKTEETTEKKIGSTEEYKKCADIIKRRLKYLKVDNYQISLDENSGKIELTIPEDDRTDTILSDITQKGNFQIVDNITGEVLLTNKDVKSAKINTSESSYYTSIYMSVNFNNHGAKAFKNITANYQNEVVQDASNETITNETETNETNTVGDTESDDESSDVKTKQVSIKIDDSTLLTTHFTEIIDNGVLQLTLGASQDGEELQSLIDAGSNVAAIVQNEAMPLQYTITGNMYVESNISIDNIKVIIYIELAISLLIMLYMIIRYKASGLLHAILSVGYMAILLIMIRLTNVVLSIEGILGIELAFIMNVLFNIQILKEMKDTSENDCTKIFNKTIKKYSIVTMPIAIIAIVFSFVNMETLYSFGMVMFWGIVISLLYNLIFTNIVIRNK